MMKKVNQAYELLKASGGGKSYSQMSDDEIKAAWQARRAESEARKQANKKKMETMLAEFEDRFMQQVPAFSDHLQEYFKLESPEIKSSVNSGYSEAWYGRISVVWPTTDNKTEIRFLIELQEDKKGGLAYDSGEPVYSASFETVLYHNRKDFKMSRRHWQWGKTSADALDPNKVFPKAKLKKIIAKAPIDKMTRKDFERVLSIELKKYNPNFRFNNLDAAFDFKREDKLWIGLMRRVMNRVPYWSLIIYKDQSPEGKQPHLIWAKKDMIPKNIADQRSSFSFPETSTSVDLLKDFFNKFITNKKIKKDHFQPAIDKQQGK
jgi:hypothetical protein